ncbi:MAG: hypothetical protein O8C64_14025 [Candidatus Methanoperedens sp.]|nr:hypothetical protein [Candidatus Methanoperedens sp.]MCZ7404036.1 hypothetical protein [Candidatus Methanoperedens sp.]
MNTHKKHLLNKYLIVLVVWLTLCIGLAAAQTATTAGILTLSLQPSLDGKGDIKATSITSAELLGLDGGVIKTATLTGGTAQFDLGSVAGGDYFIRVNNLADDLVPTRIDDPAKAINQFVGQKLRATVIGNLSDPAYTISTHSKGQGHHPVVSYADGAIEAPERYCYVLIYQKTSPQKMEIRVLGTADLLTTFTPRTATHPSTSTETNPSFPTWMIFGKSHGIDYNGTDSKCNTCHINLDTKPATFSKVTSGNGWCYRCHYGKGGDDNGFLDTTTLLAATPMLTVTSTPVATIAAPAAAQKTPAFEALLAISALLIMVLVIRRK